MKHKSPILEAPGAYILGDCWTIGTSCTYLVEDA